MKTPAPFRIFFFVVPLGCVTERILPVVEYHFVPKQSTLRVKKIEQWRNVPCSLIPRLIAQANPGKCLHRTRCYRQTSQVIRRRDRRAAETRFEQAHSGCFRMDRQGAGGMTRHLRGNVSKWLLRIRKRLAVYLAYKAAPGHW